MGSNAGASFRFLPCGFELDLLFEHIDAINCDIDHVADLVDFFGAAAHEAPASGVVDIKIAFQGGNVDQACEQKFGQFHKKAEIAGFHDHGAEFLAVGTGGLELEKLEFFEFYGFPFRIGGGSFGGRNMFGDGAERGGIRAGFGEAQLTLQSAMDDEIAVTPDRAREVGVVGL